MTTSMRLGLPVELTCPPALDPGFLPAVAFRNAYRAAAASHPESIDIRIAIVRDDGHVSVWTEKFLPARHALEAATKFHLERLVKSLLWLKGGCRVVLSAPEGAGEAQVRWVVYLAGHIAKVYSATGRRAFDAAFMANVYDAPFSVVALRSDRAPAESEPSVPVGGHLDGCRIGLDLGGSDRKVSAVQDGIPIFSEEVVWHPKTESDPAYHYAGIMDALHSAASKLPRVDSIGVSAAGIYIGNQTKVASLFLSVSEKAFQRSVRDIFLRAAADMGGVPIRVVNDGDVTALAGAMALGADTLLGIAMGTSEAAGFVDADGGIKGWLNELAFVPVDFQERAPRDEWSGDLGCGVKYFSQDAVIRLAPRGGIELDTTLPPGENLKIVQKLHAEGHPGADAVFRTIGTYLGYALADYAAFYRMRHVLVLGRVTSGSGGDVVLEEAQAVLDTAFPDMSRSIELHLPDEKIRRVGQSIAAASL
jgi:predicted NBD/HSP70 family sugar kinase